MVNTDLVSSISAAISAVAAVGAIIASAVSTANYSRGVTKLTRLREENDKHLDDLWRDGRNRIDQIETEMVSTLNEQVTAVEGQLRHQSEIQAEEGARRFADFISSLGAIKERFDMSPSLAQVAAQIRRDLYSDLYQALKNELQR